MYHVRCNLACCSYPRVVHQSELSMPYQWWRDLFRCRIDLLNFSMGFNIIAPYMEFLHLNWYLAEWYLQLYLSRWQPTAASSLKLLLLLILLAIPLPSIAALFAKAAALSIQLPVDLCIMSKTVDSKSIAFQFGKLLVCVIPFPSGPKGLKRFRK